MNTETPITENTPVLISVQFREPNGSLSTLPWHGTVKDLGVAVSTTNQPARPTKEEIDAALEQDEKNPPRGPDQSAMVKVATKYMALNADRGRDIGVRIREAVANFLKTTGLPGHKIDGGNYTWADQQASALNVVDLHDDEKGSITGFAGGLYLQVSGSAVWG